MKSVLVIGWHASGSGLKGAGVSLATSFSSILRTGYIGLEPTTKKYRCGELPEIGFTRKFLNQGSRFELDEADLNFAISDFKPGWVVVIGPPFLAKPLLRQLQAFKPAINIAFYSAIEADLTDPIVLEIFQCVDLVLTYSDFAHRSIYALASKLGKAHLLPLIVTVGHGIANPEHFFPLRRTECQECDARSLRKEIFWHSPGIRDCSFLILNGNRSYLRKRLDLSVLGFAAFVKRTDANAHLYLDSMNISDQERNALDELAESQHVASLVTIRPKLNNEKSLTLKSLNRLYNAADVGLNTAMGEGFGLVSFEHALTSVAQIVPMHTGLVENWAGASELVPVSTRKPIFYEYGDMFAVSPGDVASAIQRLHEDAEHRQKSGTSARARAQQQRFSWHSVAKNVYEAFGFTS